MYINKKEVKKTLYEPILEILLVSIVIKMRDQNKILSVAELAKGVSELLDEDLSHQYLTKKIHEFDGGLLILKDPNQMKFDEAYLKYKRVPENSKKYVVAKDWKIGAWEDWEVIDEMHKTLHEVAGDMANLFKRLK